MYYPNCDLCKHYEECSVRKALREARETIWNIGRERTGHDDYIINGHYVRASEEAQDNE